MDALMRIIFLYGLASLHKFIFSSTASFKGKRRPIYSMWDTEENEIPSGFYEVLMRIDSNGKTFTSDDQQLQIAIPTEGEESVHDFQSLYDDGCDQFYFFFTAQELQDAGYNPTRSPGFNYWNPEAIRWEPRGHMLENSWVEHRFYVVPKGYVAVCYTLQDGIFKSEQECLPNFTQEDISSASCFIDNFCQNDDNAIYFIEFSLEELRAAGIDIPDDLTGFRFNPESALFEEVEKPATPCGWDPITENWRPICGAEDKEGHRCTSRKFAFPWDSNMSEWIIGKTNDVFTYMTQINIRYQDPRLNSSLMRNFFSKNGGPYCDCNCFCDNCRRFHLPWETSKHRTYDHSSNVLSGSECD